MSLTGSVLDSAEGIMFRKLIASLLVLTFLPIPGFSLALGAGESISSEIETLACRTVSFGQISGHSHRLPAFSSTDGESSRSESIPLCLSGTEVSEFEGNKDGESGSVDLSCTFEREDVGFSKLRIVDFVTATGAVRILNPNEVFRILRC
jgi:hypothetical protein